MNSNESITFLNENQVNFAEYPPKHVVSRNIFLKLTASDKTTKVLLHERPQWSGVEGGKFQLYGGTFDPETDKHPIDTATREIWEELKLYPRNMSFFGAHDYNGFLNYYYIQRRQRVRKIRDKSGQTHIRNDKNGPPLKNGWFTLQEINKPDFIMAFNHKEVINETVRILRARENM